MKIAELSRVSGTTRSTIHYYRNLGLLPPPVRQGPKLHLFGVRHLRRLRELAALRAEGHSIAALQLRFPQGAPARSGGTDAGDRVEPQRSRRRAVRRDGDIVARERLLDLAAREFVARGYDAVRIADLARGGGISKATFYTWFSSKADLFVDCLDRLRDVVIGPEARATISPVMSFEAESQLRASAVLAHVAQYRMMTNLLAQAASGPDSALARRARGARHRMVTGARPMFERAIAAGACRPIDPELLAYMTWGALLALGDRLALDDRYDIAAALAALLQLVHYGTTPDR